MHRLARQVTSSRLPSRAARVPHLRKLLPCRVSRPHGHAIHRYYSSSSPGSSSAHDEFHRLLASIRPGVPEEELAHSIVALLEKTKDQARLQRLEALVSIYSTGLDPQVLSQSTAKYMLEPPSQSGPSTTKVDEILGEIDSLTTQPDGAKTELIVNLLDEAEREVATRPKLTEDILARAIVSFVKHTSLMSGYGKEQEKQQWETERVQSLVNLFAKAAENAELAGEGLATPPLFSSKPATSDGPIPVPALDDPLYASAIQEKIDKKLDAWFEDPSTSNQRIKDIISEFTNSEGELDAEVADALKAFGFRRPVSKVLKAAPKASSAKSDASEATFSFEQAMAETTRESKEADDLDTGALTSGKDKDQPKTFETFPNLMTPDPLMDSRDVREFPADHESPYNNRVVVRNHASIFHEQMASDGLDLENEDLEWKPEETDETEEEQSSNLNLPLGPKGLNELYRFPIFSRRVTQQTGKGKIHRIYSMVIVGNGDGLVGYGEGKDEDSSRAEAKAFSEAVRNMDWVERFEKRTVWTEMETKLGATRVILRPRPVGFGLRCNPNLHQVLKAAGIKDVSAKVWGSRNPVNVIKAAFRMLQAGNAPLAMGDGVGGKGRKLNKGSGARSKDEVERERGRRLVSLRK
ncbi:28S ribosomal protein S5, mitochondrial [Pleurotus ostreatus]|uniref:Small ribosomal subunit protein uS5m n=2 Tax=Pleurotus ostreatus TaxID=5322 RepID=A0A8H7DQN5_PLEOS|nr:28S ribosomal protein S5, mitochondrial [Pleurotus ostreatus]KAF7426167.1 28S ribosomal protein S5, mitochondrial [Pleurotus ostreatus]KAJ8693623.1 28S ribosomal protein S5, mitochondrial [Pleurotus ostreatus]